MSSPRHLWSGDWEFDSAAVTEDLAKRRAQAEETPAPPPEPPQPRARPSAAARAVAWLRRVRNRLGRVRRGRGLRVALVVALLALLGAGAAYGVTSLLSAQRTTTTNAAHTWLGIDVAGSPYGIVVADVVPGSPAEKAGLKRGDLLSEIDNQPVTSVDGVSSALDGLGPGSHVEIQFRRGPSSYITQATLGSP